MVERVLDDLQVRLLIDGRTFLIMPYHICAYNTNGKVHFKMHSQTITATTELSIISRCILIITINSHNVVDEYIRFTLRILCCNKSQFLFHHFKLHFSFSLNIYFKLFKLSSSQISTNM